MATPPDFTAGTALAADSLNKVGLWKVASATATSGSALDILGCFTSDFDSYRIVVSDMKTSGGADVYLRMLNGTTVETNSYYSCAQYSTSWTAPTFNGIGVAGGATSQFWTSAIVSADGATGLAIDLFNPNLAQRTQMNCLATVPSNFWQGPRSGYGVLETTTQYTGLRIYHGSTFTSIKAVVYGYRK